MNKLHELIVRCFSSLSGCGIAHPWRVLTVAAVVTLTVAPGMLRLKLRTDGRALASPSAPEVVFDKAIRDKFGIEDQIVVLIQSHGPEGIFTPATLQLVRDLTADLARLPGVNPTNVASLATEPSFRSKPGSIFHQTLLEPQLQTKEQLDQLREDLRRIQLYTGTFVSADGKATVILIGVPPDADRAALYRKVAEVVTARKEKALAEREKTAARLGVPGSSQAGDPTRYLLAGEDAGAPRDEVLITGAPVAESLLGIHILEHLGVPRALLGTSTLPLPEKLKWPANLHELRVLLARRVGLVPLAALVMVLIFFLCFRNVLAMLVPLPGVAATMLFVFGLMGWCGVPIYLTLAVMPVLLVATGVTNDIYLFTRYFNLLRLGAPASSPASASGKFELAGGDAGAPRKSHLDLLRETFDNMAAPVASTSLTTAVGFLSFAFSPLVPVRAFGIFTGIGVLFGMVYSLTVVPAILALLNPAWLARGRGGSRVQGSGVEVGSVGSVGSVRLARAETEIKNLPAWFSWFGEAVVRRRWWVAAIALGITSLTPLGLKRLAVQDSWMDAFDPESELRRASKCVNDQFHGLHLLFVSFEATNQLSGELSAAAISPEGINLPRGLVEHLALIGGSRIELTLGAPASAPASGARPSSGAAIASGQVKEQTNLSTQPGVGAPGDGRSPLAGEDAGASRSLRSQVELVYGLGNNVSARIPVRDIPTNFLQAFSKQGKVHYELAVKTHSRPQIIRALADLGDFIRQRRQYAVGGVLSPADYLSTTRFMSYPDSPTARQLPNDPGQIRLMWEYYGIARGQQRLHQIVDADFWQSLTTVFMKDANFVDTKKLLDDLRDYERKNLAPKGIHLGFAGDVAVSQSLIGGIVSTQLWSLVFSVFGIYLVTALLGGSWRWGVFCVLPSLLAVLIKFAVMGWAGIPLGVATSMFAAMTLGIGVNCAIQLLESYGHPPADATSRLAALRRAMALTGPPALFNTVAVSLGFGVLMLSQVPANARLGLLVVLGLANCFIASLVLLPVLLQIRSQAPKCTPA